MHFCPWVYIDFYVKMSLDGCSIPNTCAFIQMPGTRTEAFEGHTDKLFPVRKSLGEWVGIYRKQMKKAKNMQQFFQNGVQNSPGLKCFCQISPEWVSIRCQIPVYGSNRPYHNPLGCLWGGGWPWELTLTSALCRIHNY